MSINWILHVKLEVEGYLTATETVLSVFVCSTKMLRSWPEREHFCEQNEQWRQSVAPKEQIAAARYTPRKADGVAADIDCRRTY